MEKVELEEKAGRVFECFREGIELGNELGKYYAEEENVECEVVAEMATIETLVSIFLMELAKFYGNEKVATALAMALVGDGE